MSFSKYPPKPKALNRKSFYDKVLCEADQLDFQTAAGVEGIDDEITLLRIQIKAVLKNDPENIKLIMSAAEMLAKLVRIRYNMTSKQKSGLKDAITNVIKEIAVPLGIAALTRKI